MSLRRHLLLMIALKLLLLAGLWWAFVRDRAVPVDARLAAQRMFPAPATQATPAAMPGGGRDGQ